MPTLDQDRADRLQQAITDCGLGGHRDALFALAKPAWMLDLLNVPTSPPPGSSRLGGLPDLPTGVEWPRHRGQLLTFIGQINLGEVPEPRGLLPGCGLLAFFLGIDEPATNITHAVHYWGVPVGELHRAEEPEEEEFLNEDSPIFEPSSIRLVPTVSLPNRFTDTALLAIEDELEALRTRLGAPSSPQKGSQLLGYPLVIGGNPQAQAYVCVQGHASILYRLHKKPADIDLDIARAEAGGESERADWLRKQRDSLVWYDSAREAHQAEIAHWRLLLEVASHRKCGMTWWDAGRLQFYLDERDLLARNFTRTYACVQSS